MKNLFCVLVFLTAGVLNAQQMAFNFVEITAKENSQDKIAELFDEFFGEREQKSGGVFLERLRHGREDGRTHRIVFLWELDNGGWVTKPSEAEGDAFWRGVRNHVESWGSARAGRIMNLHPGDTEKYPTIHIWDIKAANPKAFAAAQAELVNNSNGAFDGRTVAFGTYDVNKPNGATHWALVAGEDINDHMSLYQQLQTTQSKAFNKYIEDRGEAVQIQDFIVERLKTYQ
ncbi:MAG: hypothetical protein RIQ82_365 [Bacteroidota bacterium]|jgi:hypothetical protein